MNLKKIIRFDALIVGFTLVVVILIIGYSKPLVIAPADDFVTSDHSVLFSFKKGNAILIDDNPSFTSPERIFAKDSLFVNLHSGTYYWKVVGARESEVRKIVVESVVDLQLLEHEDSYDLVNTGTTPLEVSVYNASVLTGKVVLDVEQEKQNVSGDSFVGRQHGT